MSAKLVENNGFGQQKNAAPRTAPEACRTIRNDLIAGLQNEKSATWSDSKGNLREDFIHNLEGSVGTVLFRTYQRGISFVRCSSSPFGSFVHSQAP